MKKSRKKSPIKKSKKKSPLSKYTKGGKYLPKYQTAGSPIGGGTTTGETFMNTSNLGSSGMEGGIELGGGDYDFMGSGDGFNIDGPVENPYGGSDFSLDNTYQPDAMGPQTPVMTAGDTTLTSDDLGKQSQPSESWISKPDTAAGLASTLGGSIGSIAGGLSTDTSVDNSSGYYDKKTHAQLERVNKGSRDSKITTEVGGQIMASAGYVPFPFNLIPLIAGGLTMAGGAIGQAEWKKKGTQTGEGYAERLKNRKRQKSTAEMMKRVNEHTRNQSYYKTGGLQKYMAGGYTKVHGPSHENGGVEMDLSGDGKIDSELEGGEGVEVRRDGGKYIWSDHLKTGGMSFAKKFEKLRKGGARPGDIEKLRIEQELAAKRDPSKLYAKYGGIMKYQQGGLEAITPNYRLQYDSIPYPDTRAAQMYNDPYANKQKYPVPSGMQFNRRDSILGRRDRGINLTEKDIQHLGMEADPNFGVGLGRQPWGVDPNKVDRVQRIESKQNGGRIPKAQTGGERPDPSYGDLMKGDTRKYTESQTSNAVNSLYNRRKPVATKRAFEDHSESEQQLIELVSGSSTKPKYTPYVPQYQNLQNQSYRRNGVDVTQRTPNYATSNMSGTINYTDATGKKITKNNPYANFEGSMGNPAQLYNDPFADKNLHPVPKNVEFTRRDSLLGIRDRNLPLSAEEIESLGAEADRNYKVPVNIPPSWGPVSANKLRHEEGKLPRFRKNGGMMKYKKGGVSRTDTGRFLAEYAAPLASVAGAAGDIGMTMSQKYTPVDPISARDVQAEKVFIDRAKDKRVGARESELIGAKRNLQLKSGPKSGKLNALRMTSLRAQEEAAQNVYDQNRQASATEQQLNQRAMLEADIANQRKDLTTSESRRAESLRKQSFENMRKKYMGSVFGELGNELASGMYKKEYINRTLPGGVDPYAINPSAWKEYQGKKNPDTGEIWTPAEIQNDILKRYIAETT